MPAPRPRVIAAPLRDAVVVAIIVVFAVLPFPNEVFRASGWELVLALLPATAMLIRRQLPFVAVGVSLACGLAIAAVGVVSPSALLAAAVSCYCVVDQRGRLTGSITVVAAAAIAFLSNGLVAAGRTNQEIAAALTISPHTAKTHVNRIMSKADARDRAQLVILAYEAGIVAAGS